MVLERLLKTTFAQNNDFLLLLVDLNSELVCLTAWTCIRTKQHFVASLPKPLNSPRGCSIVSFPRRHPHDSFSRSNYPLGGLQKSRMNSIVAPSEMKLLGQPKIPTLFTRSLLSHMKVFLNSNPASVSASIT